MSDGEYMVCPNCHGRGVKTLHGAALTSADIEAAGGQEFIDNMLDGVYDTQCPTCKGRNVIKKEDEDAYYEDLKDQHMRRMESGIWDY